MINFFRNEYFNKGVDLFLEGLAKLNYFLKRDNVDVTVIGKILQFTRNLSLQDVWKFDVTLG